MTEKLYNIVTKREKDVLGLKSLLFELSKEFGFEFIGEGAYKSKFRRIHNESFIFRKNSNLLGKYEFELKGGVYCGILDLHNFPEQLYEQIIERATLNYPKFFTECVRQ